MAVRRSSRRGVYRCKEELECKSEHHHHLFATGEPEHSRQVKSTYQRPSNTISQSPPAPIKTTGRREGGRISVSSAHSIHISLLICTCIRHLSSFKRPCSTARSSIHPSDLQQVNTSIDQSLRDTKQHTLCPSISTSLAPSFIMKRNEISHAIVVVRRTEKGEGDAGHVALQHEEERIPRLVSYHIHPSQRRVGSMMEMVG